MKFDRKNRSTGILLLGVFILMLLSTFGFFKGISSGQNWSVDFENGNLDPKEWRPYSSGDFREKKIDVVDFKTRGGMEHRLRLRADTIGTDDKTVKFLGVRSTKVFDFSGGGEISLDLDWNKQANGSYMTAGLYFCRTESSGNPLYEEEWLRVEYVGVPPGKNARLTVSQKSNRRVNWLYTEGWPAQNREGRRIDYQKLRLKLQDNRLTISENGEVIFRSETGVPGFSRGFIYLQMSSHSNYPAREVFFDNVAVAFK